MDKILRQLEPGRSYKIRYKPLYADGTDGIYSIAYTIVAPDAPNPPEVDQALIEIDSESFPSGIIISWPAPDADPQLPTVEDYLVQITDDLLDWGKFQVVVKDTQTIFSQENQLISFGQLVETIYIRVITRGVNQNFEVPDGYREYSYELEQALRPPDIVTAQGDWYSFTVNWAYTPARPDVVAGYNIYYNDELTLETTINDPTVNTYSPGNDFTIGGDIVRIGVSAFDAEDNESAITWSNRIEIQEISLDLNAPPQRQNINFAAVAGTPNVIATWENSGDAADEILNKDLAGVTIRYALASDPNNYTWIDVPFSFSDDLESFTITGLISNTEYEFSLSTYDILFNRTDYFPATPQSVTTDKDNVPPNKPISPTVSFGSENDGPMTIRVQQKSVETDDSTALAPDTSYFQVWMLNAGQTTSPTDANNPNATLIGDMPAGFGGLETQKMFYNASITSPTDVRYFYTRAVDTSGNISQASDAVDAEGMVIFGNAHIANLSANKITTDTLRADAIITVGTGTGSIKINGSGKLYSGVGTHGDDNTGFYVDSSGKFSLKSKLIFDETGLTVEGTINAEDGEFSGNILLSGSLSSGDPLGNYALLNSDGIKITHLVGTTQVEKFIVTKDGNAQFRGNINAGSARFEKFPIIDENDPDAEYLGGTETEVVVNSITGERKTRSSGGSGINVEIPTIEIVRREDGDEVISSGNLSFFRPIPSSGTNAIGIQFLVESSSNAELRAEIEHIGGTGGILQLSAYRSGTNETPGEIVLSSQPRSGFSDGSISFHAYEIKFKDAFGTNSISNSITMDTNSGVLAAFNTGNGRIGLGPRISWGTADAATATSTWETPPKEGDLHFRF